MKKIVGCTKMPCGDEVRMGAGVAIGGWAVLVANRGWTYRGKGVGRGRGTGAGVGRGSDGEGRRRGGKKG